MAKSTGGIGPLDHYEISNVYFEDPPEKDWKNKWKELKQWLVDYKIEKSGQDNYQRDAFGRYCIAISCDDLLEKMYELEEKS